MEEVSMTIDETKLRKMADEMLRQRCTSGDEHHCQKDPEAPALSLINQDLLYLKKGNFGPEKIVLSLHKFPAIIFNDDDIEERASRWVNKCVKKFNPYARYVFIRSSVIWERVHDFHLGIESYQQKVNLTAPTIAFPGIEEHDMFSIIYEHVHGLIYKNSKKEKWVMRHTEIHKFYDATLNRVLEGLKSYNNDVKYGYITMFNWLDVLGTSWGIEIALTGLAKSLGSFQLLSPSLWKELSKETISEILPSGDGSRGETLKPIASMILKGKLE
ncbi:hypothetical protein Tco_0969269 [Tanacetum coccineum]